MRIFNRIVVILLLTGLFLLGLFTVLYAFDVASYRLADLPRTLRLNDFYEGMRGFVRSLESGNLSVLAIATLVLIALLGLVLLVLELKPPSPRRVRMRQGTYIIRSAVENEVTTAIEQNPEVLQSDVNVKAQRKPGAKIDIRVSVRPGSGTRSIQSEVQDGVQQHLGRMGVPVSSLNVRVVESDPRETKTRVK